MYFKKLLIKYFNILLINTLKISYAIYKKKLFTNCFKIKFKIYFWNFIIKIIKYNGSLCLIKIKKISKCYKNLLLICTNNEKLIKNHNVWNNIRRIIENGLAL